MNNPIVYDIEGHKVELVPWVEAKITKDNSVLIMKDTTVFRKWIKGAVSVSKIEVAKDGTRTLCAGFVLGPMPGELGAAHVRMILRFEVALPKPKPWWKFWR